MKRQVVIALSLFLFVGMFMLGCGDEPVDSFTVTAPAAGAKVLIGDTIDVAWTGSLDAPKITLNMNSTGSPWVPLTIVSATKTGAKVIIPTTDYSDNATITVENNGVKDMSDPFACKPILLVSPKGGESYKVGQKVTIAWRASTKVASVRIQLSLAGGRDAKEFGTGQYNANQNVEWTIGNEDSGEFEYAATQSCVLIVKDYRANERGDLSAAFTVTK